MPLRITNKPKPQGTPAHQLKNGQIAEIIGVGVFGDTIQTGDVYIRVDDALISLCGSLGTHLTLATACLSTSNVIVEVLPDDTLLRITGNE
jgi:hypothetical protein